jgi:hypothetical protein
VKITRTSQATGITRTLDLPVTEEGLKRCWSQHPEGTEHIQNVFPDLTPGQREFLMTGMTEEEWDDMWKDDEDE